MYIICNRNINSNDKTISQGTQGAYFRGQSLESPSILAGVVLSWIYAGTTRAQPPLSSPFLESINQRKAASGAGLRWRARLDSNLRPTD